MHGHGGGGGFHHGGGGGFHHGGFHHHHHGFHHGGFRGGWGPGWGGPGFWGPGWGFGFGGPFCRPGPPPIFGYPGYYYNYPVGTAVVGAAAVGYMAGSRHNVYVRDRQQVTVINNSSNVKRYYVDIPSDVYPGEKFRVVLDGEEVLITCPEVSGPGERIIVCVEQPSYSAPVVASGTVVSRDRPVVVVPVRSVPATTPVSTTASYVIPSAPPTPSAVPIISPLPALPAPSTTSHNNNNNNKDDDQKSSQSSSSTSLEGTCPVCTFLNPSAARYCQMCGGRLKAW